MRRGLGTVVALGLAACGSSGSGQVTGVSQGGGAGDAKAACEAIAKLPCAETQSATACETELAEDRAKAEQAGCGAEFDAAVSCVAKNPSACDPDGDLKLAPACTEAAVTLAKCDPGMTCSSGGSESSCTYKCGATVLSCEMAEGAWSCVCDSGPKAGTQFSPTSGDGCDDSYLEQYCE
ncbi:MAG: hypothetical protein HYZ29_22400 [Myxococcales bacterium]|nr:hypothetical protein [Myxococcales bacterium]